MAIHLSTPASRSNAASHVRGLNSIAVLVYCIPLAMQLQGCIVSLVLFVHMSGSGTFLGESTSIIAVVTIAELACWFLVSNCMFHFTFKRSIRLVIASYRNTLSGLWSG